MKAFLTDMIARRIIAALRTRYGFKQVWDNIDDGLQREIELEIIDILEEEVNAN